MKHLLIIVTLLMSLQTSQAQDMFNCWIPWECNESYMALPVGNRKVALRYVTPPGTQYVMCGVTSQSQTLWEEVGVIQEGEHTLVMEHYDSSWSETGYINTFFVALSFMDSLGNIRVSPLQAVSTEPAPNLEVTLSQEEGVATATISSSPEEGFNFGELPACNYFPIKLHVVGASETGDTLVNTEIEVSPGEPVHEIVSFVYEQGTEEICINATMTRSHEATTEFFEPFVIAEHTECWQIEVSTGLENGTEQRPNVLYPNPFNETLQLPFGTWKIYDAKGNLVESGSRKTIFDATALTRGPYLVTVDGVSHRLIKE